MAISKLILDNTTQMDVTQDTVTAGSMLNGVTAHKNDGTQVTGNIPSKSSADLTSSTLTVTAPSGYYSTAATKTLSDGNLTEGNIKKDVTIFGVTGNFEGGVTPTGTINIQYNGIYDVTNYASASVNVAGGSDEDIVNLIQRQTSTFTHPTMSYIGCNAFAECSTLQSVNFQNCGTISSSAFYNCGDLTDISFPNCSMIERYAFVSCSKLTNASFPKCTSIDIAAFSGCIKMTTISFPSCKRIEMSAFAWCSSIEKAWFPECSYLSAYAFTRCYKLSDISFPKVTTLNGEIFTYCSSLKSVSFQSVSLVYATFANCTNLESAYFPVATTISGSAFTGCSKLSDVSFPEVTLLSGNYMFSSCIALTTLSFPKLTKISSPYMFYKCFNLISFYMMGSSLVSLGNSNAFSSTPIAGYTASTGGVYGSIYVPSSLLASYKAATNWTYFSSRFVGV